MKRRTLIKSSAAAIGFGISAPALATFLSGCQPDTSDGWKPVFLTKKEVDTLAEICERIIPRTDTPGAKDVMAHRLLDQFILDNVNPEEAKGIQEALAKFDMVANEKFSKNFVEINDDQKDAVLNAIADEGGEENIFESLKQVTIQIFFTSEMGAKEVLVFDPVPGEWKPCIPLEEVGGTWAL